LAADTAPFVWAVLDDREPYNSHERVRLFYNSSETKAMLEYQRSKNNFEVA